MTRETLDNVEGQPIAMHCLQLILKMVSSKKILLLKKVCAAVKVV